MTDKCPECGGALVQEEKYTGGGDDIRDYRCQKCGKNIIENRGTATWKVLHDANEEAERKKREGEENK